MFAMMLIVFARWLDDTIKFCMNSLELGVVPSLKRWFRSVLIAHRACDVRTPLSSGNSVVCFVGNPLIFFPASALKSVSMRSSSATICAWRFSFSALCTAITLWCGFKDTPKWYYTRRIYISLFVAFLPYDCADADVKMLMKKLIRWPSLHFNVDKVTYVTRWQHK